MISHGHIIVLCISFISILVISCNFIFAAAPKLTNKTITINDPNLKVEVISQVNLKFERNDLSPITSMAFLSAKDILLLEKNQGIVYRINNGNLLEKPLLDVNVANERERGLLGIAVLKDTSTTYVYLYFTESAREDGNDYCPLPLYICKVGNDPLGNRLYRYELVNNRLVNAKLMLDLPATPGPVHNGGVIKIGPDNNIYIITGDLVAVVTNSSYDKAQNNENATEVDGRSGVLRITTDGKPVTKHGILGDSEDVRLYYAYGIRNSFGFGFDPVTANLWDTENGGEYRGDEINLVEQGFNSGWNKVEGIWEPETPQATPTPTPLSLVNFDGKGKYSPPELALNFTVGITGIVFLNSKTLGKQYENDLFVGDHGNGKIYHFKLSKDRYSLALNGRLADKIADSPNELDGVTFATGFGGITDLEVGPDGYLYILSHKGSKATIYRISKSTDTCYLC
jgi:aldose sugar dehydrogenase